MKRKSLPTGRDFLFVEGYGNENPGAFQPTRPLRGATTGLVHRLSAFDISTHAPLAGRDRRRFLSAFRSDRISTHAPLAGRDQQKNLFPMSTKISTHAPLAGRDCHG